MIRMLVCSALLPVMIVCSPQCARAASLFCPAYLYLRPVGQAPVDKAQALYGFTLNAIDPVIANATLAFETDAGWFTARVPTVDIAAVKRHFIKSDGTSYTPTAYDSPVMYVRFPSAVQIINAFPLGMNGQACPPERRPLKEFPASDNPALRRDPAYPDQTRIAPQADSRVIPAEKAQPLFKTACEQPFRDASVVTQVPVDYPEQSMLHGERGTAQIAITVNPGGSLADAKIFASSGNFLLDQAALKAAQQSVYKSAVAYCQAVPGYYLFKVTFN